MFDGSLEILNATSNDEGVYTCFAENDRGKANSSGYLTITGPGTCAHLCVCSYLNTGNIYNFSRFFSLEATIITEPPEDTEVMVGDEVVLRCAASYDPMLDISFIWSIDFRVIDFDSEWEHYERIMVG